MPRILLVWVLACACGGASGDVDDSSGDGNAGAAGSAAGSSGTDGSSGRGASGRGASGAGAAGTSAGGGGSAGRDGEGDAGDTAAGSGGSGDGDSGNGGDGGGGDGDSGDGGDGSDEMLSIRAYYFGHSLLAYAQGNPDFHIPYNVGVLANAAGHTYDTHGQIGWGTLIAAHWSWNSDDLADGPEGFAEGENHAPFYAGQNGKRELETGDYNFVAFTDSNVNAQGTNRAPTVDAIVNFIELAREHNPDAQAMLYSCWNAIAPEDQASLAMVTAWRDATLTELAWWEAVTDDVNAMIDGPDMLLVPVSAVVAELAVDAASGELGSLTAADLFEDDVHGSQITYYAAGAAVFASMFQQSPVGLTTQVISATVGGADVSYDLPSAAVAEHIQELALTTVQGYARAAFDR